MITESGGDGSIVVSALNIELKNCRSLLRSILPDVVNGSDASLTLIIMLGMYTATILCSISSCFKSCALDSPSGLNIASSTSSISSKDSMSFLSVLRWLSVAISAYPVVLFNTLPMTLSATLISTLCPRILTCKSER